MENAERRQIVARLLKEGRKLSEIQDYLRKEKNDSITYLELRMLLSEMEAKLPDEPSQSFTPLERSPLTTPPAAPPGGRSRTERESAAQPGGKPSPTARGKTTVAVDHSPPPGAMLSGQVRFGSGAKAFWVIDELGRVGLEPELGSGRPDSQDMQEFQSELRRILEQAQGAF